jgi:hypothetical protein
MSVQQGWRSCPKCQGLFYAGFAQKGVCPAGGQHDIANSFAYSVAFGVAADGANQGGWASCPKCQGLYFDGFPQKGVCPAGGGHESINSFAYVLSHDVPSAPGLQLDWRWCSKCMGLCFGPFNGTCPAGDKHDSGKSYNYAMMADPSGQDTQAFDSGPLATDLALGGSAHLVVRANGDFTFNCHAHDSGFDNINYSTAAVLLTSSGIAFTFSHSGSTEGTVAGLPFGKPKRDDDFILGGTNDTAKNEWPNMVGARFVASLAGQDTLVRGVEGLVEDLLKQILQEAEKTAATALVALVA